jgi:hypothetical protein
MIIVNQHGAESGLERSNGSPSPAFVSMSEDLDRGRFDMICNTLMPSAKRARALDFSRIVVYAPALPCGCNGDDDPRW